MISFQFYLYYYCSIFSVAGGGLSRVIAYKKPTNRPEPFFGTPVKLEELCFSEPKRATVMRMKELLYNFGRCHIFCDDRAVPLPPWTVFQSDITEDKLDEQSEIIFNPIRMSPPTDYSTLYTTLKRMKEQMNAVGQTNCPTFFDMGLLTKALEVVWANSEELNGIIPFEGGMHLLMSLFAGIGFLYGDTGLEQLLYESDVFATGTARHILSGKDFDRAMKADVMVDEALHQRLLIQFKSWCDINDKDLSTELSEHLNHFRCNYEIRTEEMVQSMCTFLESRVNPLLEQFRVMGRNTSPTFKLWDDYLTKVSVPLKLFLSSSRHAFWDVNQYAKQMLLPFFFASNRTVYARYMPYLTLQMSRLPEEIQKTFQDGQFVAKLTNDKFNSVWIDYVLEVTENKALKSSGCIIGLTHQDNALGRWFLARPVTAKYSMTFTRDIAGKPQKDSSTLKHHSDSVASKAKYNDNVSKMVQLFEDVFIDPFKLSDALTGLVNFATGVTASPETEQSLLNALDTGHEHVSRFINERFVIPEGKTTPAKSFYNIKTMKSSKQTVKCKSKEITINGE